MIYGPGSATIQLGSILSEKCLLLLFLLYYNFIIITIYNKEKKTRIIIGDIALIV
jgi:hypothetical protein